MKRIAYYLMTIGSIVMLSHMVAILAVVFLAYNDTVHLDSDASMNLLTGGICGFLMVIAAVVLTFLMESKAKNENHHPS